MTTIKIRRGMRTCAGGPLALVAVGLMTACAVPTRPEPTQQTTSATEKPGVAPSSPSPAPTMDEKNSSEVDPSGSNGEAIPPVNTGSLAPAETASSSGTAALPCAGDAGGCSAGDAGADGGSSCPGCLIAGSCVADSAVNPDNSCEICDPARDARAWSPHDGVTCDDGLFCTTNDVCTNGKCSGTARQCEDGVACNGVSTCDEGNGKCTDAVNQCGANSVCDTKTDSCVSTCAGCLVAGVCVTSGAASAGNPCLVCDPTQSTTSYSPALGKMCGAAATNCSAQDTCNAQGQCQANDFAQGTACGSSNSNACDQADTCDGKGRCLQNLATNGTPCDDGQFCTVGDNCQGGRCVSGGQRNCGAGSVCSNQANSCQCQGCTIGGACVASGTKNPSNPCQICDPSRSASVFSPNGGAQCGAGPTECSAQDTCNMQGQCVPNDRTDGTTCTSIPGGVCETGQCVSGDVVPPVIPSTSVIASVVDATDVQLEFFLASDDVTPTAAIEYAIFYANPLETNVLSGAISPDAILALSNQGEVEMGRAFSPLPAGNSGTLVFKLAATVPEVEARVIARDQAGNMASYPPARALF